MGLCPHYTLQLFSAAITLPSVKNEKKSRFVPEIQGSKQFLRGLVPSRIWGRKFAFYTGNTGVKRIFFIVKNHRNFTSLKNYNTVLYTATRQVPGCRPRPCALKNGKHDLVNNRKKYGTIVRADSKADNFMYGFLTPVSGGDPFPLSKTEIVVGRHKSCDIVLNFTNVSGKHCKLVLSEGYWYVLDLQSTNGVKVNGNKVTDRRVDPGATLAISKHIFKLQYDPTQNGATGLPPNNMLQGDNILSQSLMQRAGLEKAKPSDTVSDEILEIKTEESASHTPRPVVQHAPRDFFHELVFD